MALIGNGKPAPGSRVDTTKAELEANGSWNPIKRSGTTDAGIKVREMYDSVSGQSWFVVRKGVYSGGRGSEDPREPS
jgi:hypothetical protein